MCRLFFTSVGRSCSSSNRRGLNCSRSYCKKMPDRYFHAMECRYIHVLSLIQHVLLACLIRDCRLGHTSSSLM